MLVGNQVYVRHRQQTRSLVDRLDSRVDFRQFEAEPKRAGDAKCASKDDSAGRSYLLSHRASQQAAEQRRAEKGRRVIAHGRGRACLPEPVTGRLYCWRRLLHQAEASEDHQNKR